MRLALLIPSEMQLEHLWVAIQIYAFLTFSMENKLGNISNRDDRIFST